MIVKNVGTFNSQSEIEAWIIVNVNNGCEDDTILAYLLEKKETLKANIDFYLQARRLALVTRDNESATRLHELLKNSESELVLINKVLLNSFYQTTKKPKGIRGGIHNREEIYKTEEHQSSKESSPENI